MTSTANTTFRSLERRRAFEEIIFQIQEAIIEGRLRPKDRLPPERELAESFGVSRASVREALRALEVFGVVVARRGTGPDAGSIVAEGATEGLTHALRLHAGLLGIPMTDVVQVRAVLEAEAAREAARRQDADGIAALLAIVDRQKSADSFGTYHNLDTEFHVALAHASGNRLLPVFMESLRSAMRRAMMEGFSRLEDWRKVRDKLVVEHLEIVERIRGGDEEGAAAAITAHITGFYEDVVERRADDAPRRRAAGSPAPRRQKKR